MSDGENGEAGLAANVRVGERRNTAQREIITTLLFKEKSLLSMRKRPESMSSVYENMGVGGRRKWGYEK